MNILSTAIVAVLVTTYLVRSACTPAQVPQTVGSSGSGQCTSCILINARGTGEMPNSQSMAYSAVNSMIQKSVRGCTVYNVNYPAGMMQNSGSGTTDIVNKVQNTLRTNPGMCFFLEGYSQGASAVMNALPKLASSANAIRGISVVGNPSKPGGLESMMGSHNNDPNFKCKILDICAPGDFLCGTPTPGATGMGGHVSYIMDSNTHNKISQFAIQALTKGVPGCGSTGGGAITPGGGLPMLGGLMGRSTGRPMSRRHKFIRRQTEKLAAGLDMQQDHYQRSLEGQEGNAAVEERDITDAEKTTGLGRLMERLKKRLGMGMMSSMNPLSSMMSANPLTSMMSANPLTSMMGGGGAAGAGGANPLSAMMGGASNPLSSMMGGRSEADDDEVASLLPRLFRRLMPGMMGGGSNPMSSIMSMMGGGGGSSTPATPPAPAPAPAPPAAAAGGAKSPTSCGT